MIFTFLNKETTRFEMKNMFFFDIKKNMYICARKRTDTHIQKQGTYFHLITFILTI